MRFREDSPEDLDRARAAVAAWREQHPAGTEDQLTAALGLQFHPDYGPVLRGALFAIDRDHARRPSADGVTLDGVRARHGHRWDFIGQRDGEIGWWASREVGRADRPATHHVVCRTLAELDAELTGLEAPDGSG
jgi:hypothetical protein